MDLLMLIAIAIWIAGAGFFVGYRFYHSKNIKPTKNEIDDILEYVDYNGEQVTLYYDHVEKSSNVILDALESCDVGDNNQAYDILVGFIGDVYTTWTSSENLNHRPSQITNIINRIESENNKSRQLIKQLLPTKL